MICQRQRENLVFDKHTSSRTEQVMTVVLNRESFVNMLLPHVLSETNKENKI